MPRSFAHMLIELRRQLASRQLDTEEDPAITQIRMVSEDAKIGGLAITATAIGPTYYAMPKWAVAGLLSWWTLAQIDGARDVYGAYGGVVNGNPVYTEGDDLTIGRTRRFLRFDGVGDYVDVGDITDIDGQAVVAWSMRLRVSSLAAERVIISRWAAGNQQFKVSISTLGSVEIGINGGLCRYSANAIIALNTWYTVSVYYDGSQADDGNRLKLYVDAVAKALILLNPTPATLSTVTGNVHIGQQSDGALVFVGDIYDVTIWVDNSQLAADALAYHNDIVSDRVVAGFFKAS